MDRYEILRPLGKGMYVHSSVDATGKFSIVYEARDHVSGSVVAFKKVQIFEIMDQQAREECRREINLLKTLNHPNVCRYLDSFVSNNELNIVLELASWGDLLHFLKDLDKNGKRLSEIQVLYVFMSSPPLHISLMFEQICAGLEHMHMQRVMHRDGTVKLGDLGLGRYFSSKTYKANSLVGTPYYMSPERMHETGYDFKSDVWSLGCLLYELLALKSPFYEKGQDLYTLCQRIDQAAYPPIIGPYSEELKTMVSSMLTSEPTLRPEVRTVRVGCIRLLVKYLTPPHRPEDPHPFTSYPFLSVQ